MLAVSRKSSVPLACSADTDIVSAPIVRMIQSRPAGQCVWEVARRRLDAGLKIPLPGANETNWQVPTANARDNGYRPQRYDCLNYSGRHFAIITTTPDVRENSDGATEYRFTLREMNAKWDETTSSSPRTFKLSAPDRSGQRRVVSGIGANASSSWQATGCYR